MTLQIITSDALSPHRHGFFTRYGGVSSGVFKGLNCGAGSSDQAEAVTTNRAMVAETIDVPRENLVSIYQVHSADVVTTDKPFVGTAPKADAIVSNTKGLAISVLTADCAPILFSDPEARVVAAAHSGWQGALKGISANTVEHMVKLGAHASNIQAVVGPCISQRNYEVGEEFLENFLAQDPSNARFFGNGHDGKYHFDLPGFCLQSLRDAGVGHAEWTGHCTYADMDKFYSYRRTTHMGEPDYGRLISVIAP